MDDGMHFPEYRAPGGCMGGPAVPTVGLAAISGALTQMSRDGDPDWLLLGPLCSCCCS
ncbi:hypothetical protein GCM10010339_56810 [Streptomyces alanosinicus]|uniref:Uncharacterized protein n=1 Tax=Streptomyces alanosinicus TaxID=68171 RepID=A0A919D3Y5_9ACTN|nr:hypothetical protein GCM10010339_56810 [Streptomyces alanosinicus]